MHPTLRWVVAVCVAAAANADAQNLALAGGVFDDRAALGVRPNFVPAANVTVKLYRDGGDNAPSADDASVARTRTNASGVYVFDGLTAASYWVVVDSRTIHANAWPEQTFGPAGSLCAHPNGSTRTTNFEGSCYGGRTKGSDDASSLATSEHVALITLRESASKIDFAFSADAVTSTVDGEGVQGSLRQFVSNANAVAGPNHMRFVPLEPAPEQRQTTMGVPPRWWMITLRTALPEVRGGDTVIDGTAYNFLSPASVTDIHPGRHGESPTIKPDERVIPRLEKPELEVRLTGEAGIVCAAKCGVRAIALHGTQAPLVARADARIEHVIVGASPDAEPAASAGNVGLLVERGTTSARHLLVTGQSQAGILVRPGAQLDGERLDVSRCGTPGNGGGILLLSNGSSIRTSTITTNNGPGVVISAAAADGTATANLVDGCTISGNEAGVLLGPGSIRNVISRNDVMWNRLGGITSAAADAGGTAPRENRLSANRFDENGLRPIILTHAVENPNELARGAATCERNTAEPNSGINPPRLTQVEVGEEANAARVVIRGVACPGEIVELYQSYVTSGVREEKPDLPLVRAQNDATGETLTNTEREMQLPSIGEFNYLGATNTQPDGTFEAMFPLPVVVPTDEPRDRLEEASVWAHQVLPSVGPSDRAFSAIAIDAAGNTSEMSVRRRVD